MSNLSLFPPPPSWRESLAARLMRLAAQGVYIGTSSWKYPGWIGQIYTQERYFTRGRFSRKRFEELCLAEYAETFPAVCGDFSFYQFPSEQYWSKLFQSAPPQLRFGFKAPEEITVKIWPRHARYGPRAGQPNDLFFNAQAFADLFIRPLEPYRIRIGTLIFEFGAFSPNCYEVPEAFLSDLDRFLRQLPQGWRYAVEVRNPEYLTQDYFELLRSHGVAHVFNSWTRTPPLSLQARMPGSWTADFTVVRGLLRPGRSYEQAVRLFEPYSHVQDEYPEARQAMRDIIRQALTERRGAFVFINNRLEGNAPGTIEGVLEALDSPVGPARAQPDTIQK